MKLIVFWAGKPRRFKIAACVEDPAQADEQAGPRSACKLVLTQGFG